MNKIFFPRKAALFPALLLVVLLAAGCSIVSQADPLAIFTLRTPVPDLALCETAMPEQLIVTLPEAGNGLKTDRIALLFDQREIKYLAGTRWDAATPALIQRQLVRYIEATGCFRGVGAEGAGLASRYRLQSDLQRLHLCYSGEDAVPVAQITLRLTLLDLDSGAVIGSKTVHFEEKAAGSEVPRLMDSMDNVTYRAMLDAARWTAFTAREHTGSKK